MAANMTSTCSTSSPSRLQHGSDGEQGPQHLQLGLHPRRSGDRHGRRFRQYRGGRRARIFPQLVGQSGDLPRLVPAKPEGRLHRFPRSKFSADIGGPAVKRIDDVRSLRAIQFQEDSGPLAHPVRPDSYIEISNFYTATVYNKGAELIRMMRTLLGEEKFRAGTDLYFEPSRRRGRDLRRFRSRARRCKRGRPHPLQAVVLAGRHAARPRAARAGWRKRRASPGPGCPSNSGTASEETDADSASNCADRRR
jgi:hypothetical protein